MRLYLIQHGLSLPEDVDPEKNLSEEGKADTLKVARFLKERNLKVDLIWHSKKERSVQTAQILLEHISGAETVSRNDINPLDSVDKFPQELQALNEDLMIVGHLPFLQRLASQLLLGSTDFELICFRNSGVIAMEYKDSWKLLWILTPDLI